MEESHEASEIPEGTVRGVTEFVTVVEEEVALDMAIKLLADPQLWRDGWPRYM